MSCSSFMPCLLHALIQLAISYLLCHSHHLCHVRSTDWTGWWSLIYLCHHNLSDARSTGKEETIEFNQNTWVNNAENFPSQAVGLPMISCTIVYLQYLVLVHSRLWSLNSLDGNGFKLEVVLYHPTNSWIGHHVPMSFYCSQSPCFSNNKSSWPLPDSGAHDVISPWFCLLAHQCLTYLLPRSNKFTLFQYHFVLPPVLQDPLNRMPLNPNGKIDNPPFHSLIQSTPHL